MNFITLKGKLSTLYASLIVLAIALVCLPANSAKAEVVYATGGEEVKNLKIDSPIVIKFDKVIKFDTNLIPDAETPNSAFQGIKLLNVTNESSNNPGVSVDIRLEIDGNVLKVIPEPILELDKDYRLEITDDIVLDTNDGFVFGTTALSGEIKYNFSTKHLTFTKLMVDGGIEDLIVNYTPRQIIVTAPIRYIDEMEVIHRLPGMTGKETIDEETANVSTESVTNLDITIDDENGDVYRMEVLVDGDQVAEKLHLNLLNNSGSSDYTFGFSGLPDDEAFDIRVKLYDKNNIILDNQVMKVSYESDKTTSTAEFKDKARTAGDSFTLYELIEKEKDLQKLLDENPMDVLKVQVTEE